MLNERVTSNTFAVYIRVTPDHFSAEKRETTFSTLCSELGLFISSDVE